MKHERIVEHGIDNLKKLIYKHGFGELEDELLKIARPSIRVQTTPVEDESELAIGQSKLGGRPDLPKEMDWMSRPREDGDVVYLWFIGQINLVDVAGYDVEHLLPKRGILYFFVNFIRKRGRVLYYKGNLSELERKVAPFELPQMPFGQENFAPCSIEFVPEVNVCRSDMWQKLHQKSYQVSDNSMEKIRRIGAFSSATSYVHSHRYVNRLLGKAFAVPDMQLECQLIDDTGNPYGDTEEQRQAAQKRKSEWQLLFQVGSDENANMM
ncbi:MAG: DUF1963 domain-containing protein, partial [Chloroflexota bacterium]